MAFFSSVGWCVLMIICQNLFKASIHQCSEKLIWPEAVGMPPSDEINCLWTEIKSKDLKISKFKKERKNNAKRINTRHAMPVHLVRSSFVWSTSRNPTSNQHFSLHCTPYRQCCTLSTKFPSIFIDILLILHSRLARSARIDVGNG